MTSNVGECLSRFISIFLFPQVEWAGQWGDPESRTEIQQTPSAILSEEVRADRQNPQLLGHHVCQPSTRWVIQGKKSPTPMCSQFLLLGLKIDVYLNSICSTGGGGWRGASLPEPSGGDRVWRHQVGLQNRFCKWWDVLSVYYWSLMCVMLIPDSILVSVFWWKSVLWKQSTFQRVPSEWEWRPIFKVNRNQMEIRKGKCALCSIFSQIWRFM